MSTQYRFRIYHVKPADPEGDRSCECLLDVPMSEDIAEHWEKIKDAHPLAPLTASIEKENLQPAVTLREVMERSYDYTNWGP